MYSHEISDAFAAISGVRWNLEIETCSISWKWRPCFGMFTFYNLIIFQSNSSTVWTLIPRPCLAIKHDFKYASMAYDVAGLFMLVGFRYEVCLSAMTGTAISHIISWILPHTSCSFITPAGSCCLLACQAF
jgi:hypothetical protein